MANIRFDSDMNLIIGGERLICSNTVQSVICYNCGCEYAPELCGNACDYCGASSQRVEMGGHIFPEDEAENAKTSEKYQEFFARIQREMMGDFGRI